MTRRVVVTGMGVISPLGHTVAETWDNIKAGKSGVGMIIEAGFGRWGRTLEMLETEVPLYFENTAGGDNAVARRFDALARLWDLVMGERGDIEIGFCFDTCHAHAAGEELGDAVERVRAIVGSIDLLHANDSRDPPGTGADRGARETWARGRWAQTRSA